MATKIISFNKVENFFGTTDCAEESTNRRNLENATAVLKTAIELELTERQRECIELYFYSGLTEDEVAKELNITKSTVCRHLQKAKERLRRRVLYTQSDLSAVGSSVKHKKRMLL